MMNYFSPLRLIGIAMLFLSILSFSKKEGYFSTLLSLFIASVFLIYQTKTLQKHFDNLTFSFKNWKNTLIIWGIDLASIAALLAFLFLLSPLYANIITTFENIKTQAGQGVTTAINVNELLKSGITQMIIYGIIIFIIFFIIYSLSRALIWMLLSQKKFSWTFIKKFTILNALWWLRCIIIAGLILFLTTEPSRMSYALVIMFLLYNYFTLIIHHTFAKTQDATKTLKNYLDLARNIRKFIIPASQALIMLLILLQVYGFIPFTRLNPALFATLYFAWFRVYMNTELSS